MKKFAIKLVWIVIPVLMFGFCYEWFVRSIPNDYTYKDAWMRSNGNHVVTLILGSSATLTGINPSQMEHSFNLAFSMNPIKYDLFLLEKYHPYHPELKNVVMPLDYGNLFLCEDTLKKYDPYLIPSMGIYMDYPVKSCDIKDYFEILSPYTAQHKVFRYISAKRHGKSGVMDVDSLGYMAYDLKKRKPNWDDIKVVKDYNPSALEESRSSLHALGEYCQQNGLRLILVSTPYWHKYAKQLGKERQKIVEETAQACVNKYGAEYKSYTFDPRFIYQEDYFYNQNHLTSIGAQAFTSVFKDDFNL